MKAKGYKLLLEHFGGFRGREQHMIDIMLLEHLNYRQRFVVYSYLWANGVSPEAITEIMFAGWPEFSEHDKRHIESLHKWCETHDFRYFCELEKRWVSR